jgi:hypothetical protein
VLAGDEHVRGRRAVRQGCGDYGCNPDGFCLQGCTANMLACVVGKACDLSTHAHS